MSRVILRNNACVTERSVSLSRVVELFETGAENIYLVDEIGLYRGLAARKGNCRIQMKKDGGIEMTLEPLEAIELSDFLEGKTLDSFARCADEIFARHPGVRELPVVQSGGAAVYVLRTKVEERELDWSNIKMETVYQNIPTGKLYISSYKNQRLNEFLVKYGEGLETELLTLENFQYLLDGKGCLLCDVDIYPPCNKFSMEGLWERCSHAQQTKDLADMCLITQDWASVKEREINDLSLLIGIFDQYYQAVHLLDDTDCYKGSVAKSDLRDALLKESVPMVRDLGLLYSEDEVVSKKLWGEKINGTGLHEAVFISNGKIIANGVLRMAALINDLSERNIILHQNPHWELISEEVAMEFFGSKRRILISSDKGFLHGFIEKFKNNLDVKIYEEGDVKKYLSGNYDWLIYGADVWPQGKTKKYQARALYLKLLAESLRRFWHENGISYYACDVQLPVMNIQERQTTEKTGAGKPGSPSIWQGLREDYNLHADYIGDEYIEVIGGHRQDAPHMENYDRSVYIAGPCIAFGACAPYGETVGARLQEEMKRKGMHWRVVNCGGYGSRDLMFNDLNYLNYLMDLPMRKGDVVIHFTQYLWNAENNFPLQRLIKSSEVFDDAEHIKEKYWLDNCTAHMNKHGYAVWAEYLSEKLCREITMNEVKMDGGRKLIPPYAGKLGICQIKNPNLRDYLKELSKHRHDARGAIVMNANPFTMGHLYLIEEARKQVDFLYVFVVEEDKSEIPFADRFAMVKKNCEGMKDVEVLPSGQYMISALTFEEYFEKEARQEEQIMPVKDVKIFAEAIAPVIGINKRFVGEEPFDKVTRQYNETMKQILPDYGIELVEIPRRKTVDGRTINATQVRGWLREGDYERCKDFLPDASLNLLREAQGRRCEPAVRSVCADV